MESPCVEVCTLEKNICIGCKRTVEEITGWSIMTNEQREVVMKRIR